MLLERLKDVTKVQVCKICFKEFIPSSFEVLSSFNTICDECYSSFSKIFEKRYIDGVEVFCLYEYKEPLDRLIIQYKELRDVELSSVFLSRLKNYLKYKYRKYLLVTLPSSEEAIQRRGFNHLQKIFEVLELPLEDKLLYKSDSSLHKELDHLKRLAHKDFIRIRENNIDKAKNILLVDDILSTGSSLKNAIKVLRNDGFCHIKALVICDNKKQGEN